MPESTPVRNEGVRSDDGIILLFDHYSSYQDGAEVHVKEIIDRSSDVSANSDELIAQAVGWPERYHLDPARANIVRGLTLSPKARVLEIGAGCGAVTRYLAETCAIVDAVEPVPSRARALKARMRGLNNVEVFVGHLEDMPEAEAYDIVVVIGVLEYVAGGSSDRTPYLDFLRGIQKRLVPGGQLVLAIENKFGVKYLAGAPEDHTGRVADSMESYPRSGVARTFARRELSDLATDAGLTPVTKIAFPDYKMTRAVIAPDVVPPSAIELIAAIPHFPSPDWGQETVRFADERRYWNSLVSAGLAAETGNSFLLLAGKGKPATSWPQGRAASYWSIGRLKPFSSEARVNVAGATISIDRAPLEAHTPMPDDAPVRYRPTSEKFVEGKDLADAIAESADREVAALLSTWNSLIAEKEKAGSTILWDLVPHNIRITPGGEFVPIDQEWELTSGSWDVVRRRGIALLAERIARDADPDRWAPAATVAELALTLGKHVGLIPSSHWIDTFVDEESDTIAHHGRRPPDQSFSAAKAVVDNALRVNVLARRIGDDGELLSRVATSWRSTGNPQARLDATLESRTWKAGRAVLLPLRAARRVVRMVRR